MKSDFLVISPEIWKKNFNSLYYILTKFKGGFPFPILYLKKS